MVGNRSSHVRVASARRSNVRRRLQISLAACVGVTTLIAFLLGRAADHAHRQSIVVAAVERNSGQLSFQNRFSPLALASRMLGQTISPEYSRRLIGINLREKSASSKLIGEIGRCRDLRSLDLRGCGVRDRDVLRLRSLDDLQYLDLSNNHLSGESLAVIGRFRGLVHLDLSQNGLDDDGVRHLEDVPRLLSLSLDENDIGDASMVSIARLSNLRNLDVAETDVTDQGLESLRSLPHLVRLRVGRVGQITTQGFRSLGQMRTLTHLSLVEQYVDDESLANLLELPRLQYLSIERGEGLFSPAMVRRWKEERPGLTIHGRINTQTQ